MWKDPIVEEIRSIRLNIEAECDNDFNKIFAQAIEAQEKLANRLASKPTPHYLVRRPNGMAKRIKSS